MKTMVTLFGFTSYLIGNLGFVYFILFLGNWSFMPHSVSVGAPVPVYEAVAINGGLLLLFGVQHSLMARPTFKAAWLKFVPAAAERAVYVLLSGLLMVAISVHWQPMPGELWRVESELLYGALIVGYLFGFAFSITATFLINHFELFGLTQVVRQWRELPERVAGLQERGLYRLVRHPIQTGVLIGIWVTPHMSTSHLFLAIGFTIYILIGLYFEERNLVEELGDDYLNYKSRVSRLLPLPKM